MKANIFIISDRFPILEVDVGFFSSLTMTIGSLLCSSFSFQADGQ